MTMKDTIGIGSKVRSGSQIGTVKQIELAQNRAFGASLDDGRSALVVGDGWNKWVLVAALSLVDEISADTITDEQP